MWILNCWFGGMVVRSLKRVTLLTVLLCAGKVNQATKRHDQVGL